VIISRTVTGPAAFTFPAGLTGGAASDPAGFAGGWAVWGGVFFPPPSASFGGFSTARAFSFSYKDSPPTHTPHHLMTIGRYQARPGSPLFVSFTEPAFLEIGFALLVFRGLGLIDVHIVGIIAHLIFIIGVVAQHGVFDIAASDLSALSSGK